MGQKHGVDSKGKGKGKDVSGSSAGPKHGVGSKGKDVSGSSAGPKHGVDSKGKEVSRSSAGPEHGVDSKGKEKGKDVSGSSAGPKHGVGSKGKDVSDSSAGPELGVDSKGKGKEVTGLLMGRKQSGGEIVTGPSPFDDLPEDCISSIISFTSPRDACVSSSVSKTFESAVQSDSVWDKFLPLDYTSLAPASRVFSSKKELYFLLCHHFLIEDGKKSFWLEKSSGKRCIMVSSKEMWITWGSSPQYWQWISIPESRFENIAELLNVCWFEIHAKLHTRYLSPGTRYSVYIVFKTKNGCPGLGDVPVEAEVGLVGQESSQKLIYFVGPSGRGRETEGRDVTRPEEREDGWMEAELGEFYNESCCDDISASVVEIKSPYWKRGLIIQGFEFRPAKTT